MLSRREVVGKLAVGTAAVCVAGAARASVPTTHDAVTPSTDPAQPEQLAASAPQAATGEREFRRTVVDAGPPETLSAPAPWELMRPLAMGSLVANGWRVAALTGVANGSCVLTLQNERGRAHRVHLCRNDGRPQGLVYTKRFDLVVMNGGQGDLPTDEGFAHAVVAAAHVLAANEGDRRHGSVIDALLPHAQRVERFAAAAALR
jgi:hypothetical protein